MAAEPRIENENPKQSTATITCISDFVLATAMSPHKNNRMLPIPRTHLICAFRLRGVYKAKGGLDLTCGICYNIFYLVFEPLDGALAYDFDFCGCRMRVVVVAIFGVGKPNWRWSSSSACITAIADFVSTKNSMGIL